MSGRDAEDLINGGEVPIRGRQSAVPVAGAR
jgi:hypothetical protein